MFGAIGGGILVTKIGYYSPLYIAGAALALVGSSLLFTADVNTRDVNIYGYSILIGLGSGLYIQLSFSIAQAKVPAEAIGAATGFISFAQLLGPVLSLTIAGTVLVNSATSGLKTLLPNVPEALIKNAIAGTSGQLLSTLDSDTRQAALTVIVSSISKVYILAITASAVGLVAAVHLKHERLELQPGGTA